MMSTVAYLCDCCGRWVQRVRYSQWHGEHAICLACFYVWYDSGCEGAGAIKDYVLQAEREGMWPFPDPKLDRVPFVTAASGDRTE